MHLIRSLYLSWLRIAWFLRRNLGIKTYGIGWIATKVCEPFDFNFRGSRFRFLPNAARSYCLLPAGIANEPETHQFLERLLAFQSQVTFIDVGSSIGEFAIPMAHDSRVLKVLAFEPHPATAEALRTSAQWVPNGKIVVIEKAVGANSGMAVFDTNDSAPTNAGLKSDHSESSKISVEVGTIDENCTVPADTALLLLMDIEGGELDALKGAKYLIKNHKPLIIFEYNDTTKKSFKLADAIDFLGDSYKIYRLRSEDGKLDRDLTSTWNVVAIPNRGVWEALIQKPGILAN